MGGHGGLNILPQKRWNVYNFDNREKVRKDEENAAKEEQLKREQYRRRDSELRLQQLRRTRNLVPDSPPSQPPLPESPAPAVSEEAKNDSKHINLFEGIKIFDPIMVDEKKRKRRDDEENDRMKKMMKSMRMKKEEVRVVGPEDEKYRLGYGVVGKGVKAPWYALKRNVDDDDDDEEERRNVVVMKKTVKKSVEELREERLKREMAEMERERALLSRNGGSRGWFSR
ncbi:hypothetical protein RND81_08G130000 [Saponaria officinalis]